MRHADVQSFRHIYSFFPPSKWIKSALNAGDCGSTPTQSLQVSSSSDSNDCRHDRGLTCTSGTVYAFLL